MIVAMRSRDIGLAVIVNLVWGINFAVIDLGLRDLPPLLFCALRFGLAHMTLNLVVVGMFIGNFVWRHDSYYESVRVQPGQLALSAVAIGLLLVSGWIGGMLAYRYGVRVADESTTQVKGYA